MNRLLKAQLKKSYGKDFNIENSSKEFQKLIELIEISNSDFERDRDMLQRTLEVSSQELTESNKEIVHQHELLRSVTNSVSDVIFYKDLNFKYIGCNKNFELFTGKKEAEIIGKEDYDLFEKKHADLFRSMDIKMLKSAQEQTNKEWVKLADGKPAYFSTFKSPLFDDDGQKIGIVGVSRDITKEHVLQEELDSQHALIIQQSRLASMGEMISNIAHQWRQPLNALGLLLQNIENAYEMDILDKEYITHTINKGNRLTNSMSQTIDDFRNFFKPNKESEVFSISSSINSTMNILESSLNNNLITLNTDIDDSICIKGFSGEFSQVILNILNNSKDALIEFIPDNRQLFIRVFKDDENAYLEIADNAGGIPEKILEKIFDPYFTTKEEGKGTGIGLYMSKTIIEKNMNGSISVENKKDGALFRIVLNSTSCKEEKK